MTPQRSLDLLIRERERTERRLARLREDHLDFVAASRDSNADDEHDPEGATIAFERSQVEALIRQTEAVLAEIAAAERRLEDGSWGTCAACGESIPALRLEARPTALHCMSCA